MKFSFFNWNGLLQGDFVGIANFNRAVYTLPLQRAGLDSPGSQPYFFVLTMVVQNGIGLALAVALDRGMRGSGFFRNTVCLPHLLPTVVVGFLWYLMLNPQFGVINQGLEATGLGWVARPWLGDPSTAFTTIAFVNAWSWIGFPMVIFLANLASIPDEYDEAAKVDGANSWQRFRYISLPLLVPSLTIVTVLTFIGNFNAFDLVYSMAGSEASPGGSTDVLGLLFYPDRVQRHNTMRSALETPSQCSCSFSCSVCPTCGSACSSARKSPTDGNTARELPGRSTSRWYHSENAGWRGSPAPRTFGRSPIPT